MADIKELIGQEFTANGELFRCEDIKFINDKDFSIVARPVKTAPKGEKENEHK